MEYSDEQSKLRKFILNDLESDERSEIEERLLADTEYFEEVLMAEESLIQDYADELLDAGTREKFEKHFLSSQENRQKVQFARALRKYVNENQAAPETEKKPRFFDSLKAFFAAPYGIGFAVLLIAVVVGFLVWKNVSQSSEVLTALNRFQKNSRPTQARISGFDYAPKIEGTRGGKEENLELVSAKARATEAVLKNETAENLHELGRVYLAENNYDEAIKQFEKALKKNSNLAKIHNDLGVALMEKGRQKKEEKLDFLSRAKDELDKAVELDKNLTEAYFNRALVIELMNFPNQAKEAWENYLKMDDSSQWANEAREHLEKLSSAEKPVKKKEEILESFLQAFQANNKENAWLILSRNREIISGKLVPQQLTFFFTVNKTGGNEDEARKFLDALNFAGRLEEEKAGDPFWREVADFYSKVSPENVIVLQQAHESLFNGFKSSGTADYTKAIGEFETASQLFLQTGNIWQKQISDNYIANYLQYADQKKAETEAEKSELARQVKIQKQEIVNRILNLSQAKNYKWLELLMLVKITSIQNESGQHSDAIRSAEKSYLLAQNIGDTLQEQRMLGTLATVYGRLGNKKKAIALIQKVFETMGDSDNSLSQKWRNYFYAADLFISVRNYSVARLFIREELLFAEQIGESVNLSTSQTHAGKFFAMTKNFSEARTFLNRGIENAQKITNTKVSKSMLAYALLKLADLEQETGNHDEAARLYTESFNANSSPYFDFEIKKGRLRSFLALGNNTELEQQIPQTIRTAEDNRLQIKEEEQNNSFSHNEISVFDTAIEWEFGRGNFQEAYNYAESASARSLLDLMNSNNTLTDKNNSPLIKKTPLKLSEIQSQMPAETQILQYSVLDKKTLIWLITKDKFIVKELPVSAEELQNKVERFISLLIKDKKGVSPDLAELSRDLYSLFIEPVYAELDKEKQLCLIPGKALFFLPFSALLSSAEKPLLEEFVISYSPSANIFIHCVKDAEAKLSASTENILSIGNPAFDTDAFPELANLEFAETEAKNIAGLYDAKKILVNKSATKKAFQENLGNANVLHFAGHYVANSDVPLLSSLLFAKNDAENEQSTLTNGELANENLSRYKLVILSSCDSGVENYLNGEGMIGLSRTFLATGVPLVVASQWKVDSEATAQLMENFHRNRREKKLSTAVALRKAQIEMLGDGKFKTPYYWSAFAVFGGFAKF